ncbi:LysR family transcriptional regulator [Streptomyces sp. NBC_01016]|uniref:LysR family transcriptional regulator n=1 Tax=Streptomyces sp. NBC_01016 TaxID=2903720 RepID=UPI00225974B1|nr:LysR family transcriptional regulator [Streptomyces sp. NBC_01016]MCX4835687.1 LysR family transcriptional regulator [Streptomyces sp. NBC_01016]
MLEVRRLRLLAEFATHGTVAATAEALHLTGPAVSQQLAALEKETGLTLLEKHGRALRLTGAGRLLVEHAQVVLADLAAAQADVAALRQGRPGAVRVAAFPSAARVLLPLVWPEPGADAPRLHLVEHEPDSADEALRQRTVDVAVTHAYSLLPRPLPPGCEQRHLFDEPVELALHPDTAARHGLAPGDKADLAAFAQEAWLVPGADTACHEMTQRACGAAGFVPRAVARASDFGVLTALVARDAGVALVPQLALPADLDGVSLHPLHSPVRRTVRAVYRAGTAGHPDVAYVLDRLSEAASGRPR